VNPFEQPSSGSPPLSSDKFTEQIVSEHAADADGVGIDACIGHAVHTVWPVVTNGEVAIARSDVDEPVGEANVVFSDARKNGTPDGYEWWTCYRRNQHQAVIDILSSLYVEDNSVVTLSAPTGAGKSLILHGVMATLHNEFDRDAFFSTPLNALIDQVDNDEFINGDSAASGEATTPRDRGSARSRGVVTLKGKNNYQCVHRQDRGAPVDKAVCQRVSDFDCQHKETAHTNGGCPYYGRKHVAQQHPEVVTNLSYLMANSMIPDEHSLDSRELVVVDECQKIEDFALQFVGVTVSERSVPSVWDRIESPPATDNVEQLAEWLENEVLIHVNARLEELEARGELNESEASERDDLQQFSRKVDNLLYDIESHHWVANHEYGDDEKVEFTPIFVGRFLDRFLWSQGQKVVLSSATIPKGGFLEEIGLDDRKVGEVTVPSTFPPERRGVYTDEAVGKMTMSQRDSTIPKMAGKIGELAEYHEGKRGFIHCHSYSIAQQLYDALSPAVRERTRLQDSDDREGSLDDWLDADVSERGFSDSEGGQIFLSVAQDEGISLDDEAARWQVVAKLAYPYMGSKRVEYRMDKLDDWNWYANKASIALQQAVGRGMRSKDDWCHTYILDSSVHSLLDRNKHLFESWFLEAVDIDPEGDRA
jgi:Rad3-related DNA helicase